MEVEADIKQEGRRMGVSEERGDGVKGKRETGVFTEVQGVSHMISRGILISRSSFWG